MIFENKLRTFYRKLGTNFNQIKCNILNLDPVTGFKVHKIQKSEKLGTDYGGWIIPPEAIDNSSICYCVGAGEDISFDCELANRFGCEVYIFDPTPRAKRHFQEFKETISKGEKIRINNIEGLYYNMKPEKLQLLNYFDYGIWSKTELKKFFGPKNPKHVSHSILNLQKTDEYFKAKCKRLSQIMNELGHKKLDLLKLDIEGAEYEVIESIIEDNLDIKLICVEFDELNNKIDDNYLKRIKKSMKNLLKNNYVIIAKDSNSGYTFLKKYR